MPQAIALYNSSYHSVIQLTPKSFDEATNREQVDKIVLERLETRSHSNARLKNKNIKLATLEIGDRIMVQLPKKHAGVRYPYTGRVSEISQNHAKVKAVWISDMGLNGRKKGEESGWIQSRYIKKAKGTDRRSPDDHGHSEMLGTVFSPPINRTVRRTAPELPKISAPQLPLPAPASIEPHTMRRTIIAIVNDSLEPLYASNAEMMSLQKANAEMIAKLSSTLELLVQQRANIDRGNHLNYQSADLTILEISTRALDEPMEMFSPLPPSPDVTEGVMSPPATPTQSRKRRAAGAPTRDPSPAKSRPLKHWTEMRNDPGTSKKSKLSKRRS